MLQIGCVLDRSISALQSAASLRHPSVAYHRTVEIKNPANISLGEHVIIGLGCTLGAAAPIHLGHHLRLSKGVIVETAGLDLQQPPPNPHVFKPIVLEDGVWVGARAIILGGVRIGRGTVICAGVVVSRDVPAGIVVAGAVPRARD